LKSRAGLRIVSATVQYLPGKDAEGLAEEGIVVAWEFSLMNSIFIL